MKEIQENKIKLTKELLQKEYHAPLKIILFSVFVIAGLGCFLSAIFYYKNGEGLIQNMVLGLIIAILFCAIGLKNIVKIVKNNKAIKNGEYTIAETVSGKLNADKITVSVGEKYYRVYIQNKLLGSYPTEKYKLPDESTNEDIKEA